MIRLLAFVGLLACWAITAAAIISYSPYPDGERHCDATGCWQRVTPPDARVFGPPEDPEVDR